MITTSLAAAAAGFALPAAAQQPQFRQVPSQYIAALGPASAKSGNNAHTWGHWADDPGPNGVFLRNFEAMKANGGKAPAGWTFDPDDWWLDENGLIMKKPVFPMPSGRFLVTNAKLNIAMLTVGKPDADGNQSWELSGDKTLGDITHQKCRSSRYRPEREGADCSPSNARQDVFPLSPGEDPPPVHGCDRKVYAVPIIFAVEVGA